VERTITPTELQALMEQGRSLTLLDVRLADDRAKESAAIPGAAWRDPSAIETWSGDLNPGSEIVLYCVRGGSVSNSVVDALRSKGLKARFIEGGMEAWKAAGGATESHA
jgi:rhodanese-related sulfurtransferase